MRAQSPLDRPTTLISTRESDVNSWHSLIDGTLLKGLLRALQPMVGASGVEPWVPKGFYDGYTSRAGHWYRGRRADRRNWRVGSHRSCIHERGGEGVNGLSPCTIAILRGYSLPNTPWSPPNTRSQILPNPYSYCTNYNLHYYILYVAGSRECTFTAD